MAKAKGKNGTKSSSTPARQADTAERLAALRWLAMRIEQLSIEILVTDPAKFSEVEDALRAQVRLLQRMGQPIVPLGDGDCPGGYILCRDGLCAPMCDEFIAAAAPHRTGKNKS
jgi:hypothetical protein